MRSPCRERFRPSSGKYWWSQRLLIAYGLAASVVGALLIASPMVSYAQPEEDVVVTRNGDVLRGEVKTLDRGLLRFETDATDTISVQWTHVASLTSPQNFRFTLDDGRQLFGSLVPADSADTLRMSTDVGTLDTSIESVVRMTPIEGRLIDRIDMSIDLGYNIAKANNLTQSNLGYNFSYRSEERLVSLSIDGTRSSTADESPSLRTNSIISYRRFADDRRWDPMGIGAIERNDELQLDRRLTLGGGMARWLTDTNSNRISFVGGLVATQEKEAESIESDSSIEAVAGITLDWFRYDAPELDVWTQLVVYERLSDSKRTRGNLDANIRWELINDFFWGFSLYYTFNSQPVGIDVSSDDYGFTTTVGWSF